MYATAVVCNEASEEIKTNETGSINNKLKEMALLRQSRFNKQNVQADKLQVTGQQPTDDLNSAKAVNKDSEKQDSKMTES